jgi:hypothetical protein
MNSIELSSDEKALFMVLIECAEGVNVVLRVAGGWVRDKCLEKASQDIDVVVAGMGSEVFAARVVDMMRSKGEAVKGMAVMAADPGNIYIFFNFSPFFLFK